jgi:hypothetical protein
MAEKFSWLGRMRSFQSTPENLAPAVFAGEICLSRLSTHGKIEVNSFYS